MGLETKTKWVSAVISLNGVNDFEECKVALKKYLDAESNIYAFILHNLDVKDDGEYKTPHYHLCAEFKSPRRLSSFLRDFSEILAVNPLAVSIEKCVSMSSYIQYLVHKNDPDKVQYRLCDIVTNIDEKDMEIYMNAENGKDEFDRIWIAVSNASCRLDIMRALGMSTYTKYYRAINDMWDYACKTHH